MNRLRSISWGTALWLAAAIGAPLPAAGTAEVTTASGEVVRGALMGNLLLAGKVKQETKDTVTEYTVTYLPTDARFVRKIDGSGVHVEKDSPLLVLVASREGSPPDDLDVVGVAMSALLRGPVETIFERLPGGGSVLGRAGKRGKAGVLTEKLLGEIQQDGDDWRITPAVRVETDSGIVAIPVEQLVAFGE